MVDCDQEGSSVFVPFDFCCDLVNVYKILK